VASQLCADCKFSSTSALYSRLNPYRFFAISHDFFKSAALLAKSALEATRIQGAQTFDARPRSQYRLTIRSVRRSFPPAQPAFVFDHCVSGDCES